MTSELHIGDRVAGKICEKTSGELIDYEGTVVNLNEHGVAQIQVPGWRGTVSGSLATLKICLHSDDADFCPASDE